MRKIVPLRAALEDDDLFRPILGGDSWSAWRTLLIASMGEELTDEERATFSRLTGGHEVEPRRRVEEFWAIVGRRGGKSRSIATLVVYLACLVDHSANLAVGECGVLSGARLRHPPPVLNDLVHDRCKFRR